MVQSSVVGRLHLVPNKLQDPAADVGQLVRAARTGIDGAFRSLYDLSFPWVERLAFRLQPHRGEAEDLMQDAFTHAFANLDQLKEPSSFPGWLRGIMIGIAHKRARRLRLFSSFGRDDDEVDFESFPSPGATAEERAELVRLMSAIERLPAQERLFFILRRVEGLTVLEVAEASGVSEKTVKRRIVAATERLTRWGVLS